jgi:tetratricopeptide (TPR) repeat protein
MSGNPESEYRIEKLNLLAFPRSEHPMCALTGTNATVQLLTKHNSIYYGNEASAEQAWHGILNKIDHLLGPLSQPAPIIGTSDERARRVKAILLSKKSLVEFCMNESARLLHDQKYQLAIPGAVQALKFSKEVFGDLSVEVVLPYLLLAQISLGTKLLSEAESYLSQAKWNVMNAPHCPDRVKSRLHQLYGQLYSVRKDFDEARSEFARSVYYSTRCFGAESIGASSGYYRLGEIFLAQGKTENALAFFDKVVDIWYKYLSSIYSKVESGEVYAVPGSAGEEAKNTSRNATLLDTERPVGADEAVVVEINQEVTYENQLEGQTELIAILEHRQSMLGASHIATGEAQYTLGLFEYFFMGNEPAANFYLLASSATYTEQLGAGHPSTVHVRSVHELVGTRS